MPDYGDVWMQRHRLPRHTRAHHRTVFYVAGESAAAACGEMHSGVASYGGQPNIPYIRTYTYATFLPRHWFYQPLIL
jgi:hypothetical protein